MISAVPNAVIGGNFLLINKQYVIFLPPLLFLSFFNMSLIQSCFFCHATETSKWRRAQSIHFDHFLRKELRDEAKICNSCYSRCAVEMNTVSLDPPVRSPEWVCGDLVKRKREKRGGLMFGQSYPANKRLIPPQLLP